MNNTETILQEYRANMDLYREMATMLPQQLNRIFREAGITVAAIEQRIKSEESLKGKLELKGSKYNSIYDITDIVGVRVITFYIDDIDKIAAVIERLFDVDWENSVDKRKNHGIDSFGYLSLHYICSVNKSTFFDPERPQFNKIRFEVQMRTVLQHAWANMNHDTGYKSGVEVPQVYLRNLSRLAGMLEMADDEFSRIRRELSEYRRRIKKLVASGNLNEVTLDGDSFKSYLEVHPFRELNHKISTINQSDIREVPLEHFLPVLKAMGFTSLGDLDKLIKDYSEAAYQLACFQLSMSDIDTIPSSTALQNLCTTFILSQGGGFADLKLMLDTLNGPSEQNAAYASRLLELSEELPFIHMNYAK